MDRNSLRTASRRVVLCALLAAMMTVLQMAMAPLPNIEPVSLLVLVCALVFGRDVFYIIFTFVLLEGLVHGFQLWWVSYLYIWPLWAAAVLLLRRGGERQALFWAAASGAFGLGFGALCALPYLAGGPWAALSYWVAGIPFDLLHCAGNFFLALALEKPLYVLLKGLKER
jgi:energy-coupling factor transport system substrate-specific component